MKFRARGREIYVGVQTIQNRQKEGNYNHTFTARADFKEARSQTLRRADAEALVVWVLLFAGQNGARWGEAVGRDAFHLHLLLKLHVDGPGETRQ